MRTLLVGYDLKKPGQNYGPLYEKLKSYQTWWHALDSTWMVRADLTVVQLRDQLRPFIDSNDGLLVMDVTSDAAAWVGFSQQASDWIHAQL
jgi:hypothetical protein